MQFKTTVITIGDLLTERHPFRIPAYQRAYAWKNEELGDFCEDINRMVADGEAHHFFGGLVSIEYQDESTRGRGYQVIDGQQRLATFTLLLKCLADALDDLGDDLDQAKEQAAFVREEFLFHRGKPKLHLSRNDNSYFSSLLSTRGPANPATETGLASQQLLYKASETLRRDCIEAPLKDKSVGEQLAYLLSMRERLTMNATVIHVVTLEKDDAYSLFAVLNDRGRSLGAGDLLRSYTLQEIDEDGDSLLAAIDHWDQMLTVDADKFEKFLETYLPARTGLRASKSNLFKKSRELFDTSSPKACLSDVERLKNAAICYHHMIDSQWPYQSSKAATRWDQERLSYLVNVLRHTLGMPLLLAVYENCSEEEFIETVRTLEIFAFRYINICKQHPSRAKEQYYEACKAAQSNSFSVEHLRKELAALVAEYADDAKFKRMLREEMVYKANSTVAKNLIRYFFLMLETHSSAGETKKHKILDLSELDIEHIYPQNPDSTVDSALEAVKHEYQNLTLLVSSDNREASNSSFSVKRPIYKEAGLEITRALSEFEVWSTEVAAERRRDLSNLAEKIWKL